MKAIRALLCCLLIPLFLGCGAKEKIQTDDSTSKEQFEIAQQFAKEFGIQKILSVRIEGGLHLPSMVDYLVVRGDEHFENGKGKYKELLIFLEDKSFPTPANKQIRLSDCSLRIAECVEIEVQGQKKRIIVKEVDTDFALNILRQFYNSEPVYDRSLNPETCPPKECIWNPEQFTYDDYDNCYELELEGNYLISFIIKNKKIVVTQYSRYVN